MTTKDFTTKLTADNTVLIEKLQDCKAPEEAYAVAKAEVLTDTFDAFTSEMEKFYESVKDLTDDDMQSVAGGADASDVVATASLGVSIASVCGAAAVAVGL